MNPRLLKWAAPLLALLVFIPFLLARLSDNTLISSADQSLDSHPFLETNLAAGRSMQALYQVEARAAQTGWTYELVLVAGQTWEQAGDLGTALAYWEIGLRLKPDDTALVRHLAQAYLDLQRWSEASDTLRRLLILAPDDNRAHYELGLLEAPFDPRSASEHLRLAARDTLYRDLAFELLPLLAAEKIDAAIAMQVGLILAGHDLWANAELVFDRAAALGESFPEALAYLGLARDRQGKDGRAPVDQAYIVAPDNAQVLYLRGLHLRAVYDYEGSLDHFAKAMAADPTNPAYAAELSTAYRLASDLPSAEAWLKTAVTLSNDDPRFQDLLAAFYADLGSN